MKGTKDEWFRFDSYPSSVPFLSKHTHTHTGTHKHTHTHVHTHTCMHHMHMLTHMYTCSRERVGKAEKGNGKHFFSVGPSRS